MRSFHRDAMMMGLVLILMVAAAASLGALGVVDSLNGNALRAATSLLVPAYLAYWAWQVRDQLSAEPLIPVFGASWLAGLPVGWVIHSLHQAFA